MNSGHTRIVKVTDLNPHLLCVLCGGYYVDATTIIECLHSFCKSCIVKYLETNKYCPICDVQVHKTKPLLNIRSDKTLQAIVYKLVPNLFQKELQCRREFYKTFSGSKANDKGIEGSTIDNPFYLPDEPILLGVQYSTSPTTEKINDKRYLNCPAAITIQHLQKLMSTKFNLNNSQKVEFLHNGDLLPDYISLMDLAYMYNWKRKHPVELEYRLLECQQKKIKLVHEEMKIGHLSEKSSDEPDREVQLQISENGIISVQSVPNKSINNSIVTASTDSNTSAPENMIPVNKIQAETFELMKSLESSVELEFDKSFKRKHKSIDPPSNDSEKPTSILSPNTGEATGKIKSISDHNKINTHFTGSKDNEMDMDLFVKTPITKPENILGDPSEEISSNIKSESNTIQVCCSPPVCNTTPVNIQDTSISIQKVYPGATRDISNTFVQSNSKQQKIERVSSKSSVEKNDSLKQGNSTRYKTLKTAVKTWNPTIPRSTIIAMKQARAADHDQGEPSNKTGKSPKFFKMRNVPRFLGNPASGVKPMYQVMPGSEPTNQTPHASSSSLGTKSNNEVTIMKIDPKTLNPIPVSGSAQPAKPPTLSLSKASNPFTYSTQNPIQSHSISNRSHVRSSSSKSGSTSIKSSSHAQNANISTNPFLLPSHHMVYSGFPRPFPSVDSSINRLPSDNQIFRAMSMLCSPSAAFHPSLPPSISMLFNPHHPHQRTHNDKLNLKFPPNDFYKPIPSSTPSVQRVPPSGPNSKLSSGTMNSESKTSIASKDISKSTSNSQEDNKNDVGNGNKESNIHTASTQEPKENSSNLSSPNNNIYDQNSRQYEKNIKPLSNGLSPSMPRLYDSTPNKSNCEIYVNSHINIEAQDVSVKNNEKKADKNKKGNS